MFYYKILTKEERDHLRKLKKDYKNNKAIYEKQVEDYLYNIKFNDRLATYLKDKWYIKLLKIFLNKKKDKTEG